MSAGQPPPVRWVDDPRRSGPIQDLLEKAAPAEELSPESLAQVRARLGGVERRRRTAQRQLVFGLLTTTIAVAGVATAATIGEWWPAEPPPPAPIVPRSIARRSVPPEPKPKPSPPVAAPVIVSEKVLAPKREIARPEPAPPPAPAPARPTELPASAPSAPALSPPAPSPTPPIELAPAKSAPLEPLPSILAEESALLGSAFRALHQQHQPARALELLDQYRARFPAGELSAEAALARVEALLAVGQRGRALQALDALRLEQMPRRAELRLIRGELRANASRCAEAIVDFGESLVEGAKGDLEERALMGRAACLSARGDRTGARSDLERYLSAFPSGRFAKQARAALQ